jgi:hypothetical protein
MRRRPHSGHVTIRLLEIAAELTEDPGKQLLARRVVNEPRFEVGQDRDVLLGREAELRQLGIERPESFLGHLSRQATQFERALAR